MKQIITVSVCLLVVQVPLDQPESAKTWQETNVQIWYLRFEEKNARKSKTESESRHVWRNVNKNYRSKIIHKPTTPSPLAIIRCNGEQRKRKTFSLTHRHTRWRTDRRRTVGIADNDCSWSFFLIHFVIFRLAGVIELYLPGSTVFRKNTAILWDSRKQQQQQQ